MPKYKYERLRVMCVEGPYFKITEIREAVEYLKSVPQTGYTGLQATVDYKDDVIWLEAQPMLQLADIEGKTPAEVWAMFDAAIDEKIRDHRARRLNGFKVN